MELPQFTYVRPPDLSGIGDAMDNRYKFQLEQARANHLARQDEIALQNEMLRLKAGQTAAANAAIAKAKEAAAAGVLGNYGLTENAIGKQGSNFTGVNSGLSSDPNAYVTNELIKRNLVPQAKAVNELFKTQAETDKENSLTGKAKAETTGILSDNQKKAVETRAAQFKEYSDAILRAGSIQEVDALIDSHAQALTELGVPPENAKKNFRDAYVQNGGDGVVGAFEKTLIQSAKGAVDTSTHYADIAQKNSQTFQANAAGTKSMGELAIAQGKAPFDIAQTQALTGQANAAGLKSQGELAIAQGKAPYDIAQTQALTGQANATAAKSAGDLELAQQKQTWEQRHPGYELKETSQGWVAINKNNPNDVTLIKLGNEPAMPKPTSAGTFGDSVTGRQLQIVNEVLTGKRSPNDPEYLLAYNELYRGKNLPGYNPNTKLMELVQGPDTTPANVPPPAFGAPPPNQPNQLPGAQATAVPPGATANLLAQMQNGAPSAPGLSPALAAPQNRTIVTTPPKTGDLTEAQKFRVKNETSKDYATATDTLRNVQDVMRVVEELKKAKLGPVTGYMSTIPSFTDAATKAETQIGSLKAKMSALGKSLSAATGKLGNLAVQEYKMLSDQISNFDPYKGEAATKYQLGEIDNTVKRIENSVRDVYSKEYGGEDNIFPQYRELPTEIGSASPNSGTTSSGVKFTIKP